MSRCGESSSSLWILTWKQSEIFHLTLLMARDAQCDGDGDGDSIAMTTKDGRVPSPALLSTQMNTTVFHERAEKTTREQLP